MLEKIKNNIKEYVSKKIPEKKYDLNISEEAEKKIEYIKKIITDRKDINCVVYFNHISFADPLFAGHVAMLIDPKETRKLVAPISYSHTELKLRNSATWGMKKLVEICGVETHRVIQQYQKNNKEYGYGNEKILKINKKYFDRLIELKKKDTPVCLLISPEGHRSEKGILEKGGEGFAVSGRILAPTLYIPVGIFYNEEYERGKLNFGKSVTINVGEVYFQESRKREKNIFPLLMKNLADTLPLKMRGQWADIPEIRKN